MLTPIVVQSGKNMISHKISNPILFNFYGKNMALLSRLTLPRPQKYLVVLVQRYHHIANQLHQIK